ncbi:Uncharacterized conserved protein [Butyrivibrio sp. ob235]|uniref:DNA/RNA helicase domain-containing protein n=1 Tax=Butyrivibrio sp. ob235 TaxID=1761780 RepID=UPI0008C767ED|nr:DNA/RNA helicase domain-containing protein [Butyrivibrio sp. ob235]SEK68704.1 Uncharacterized conserved protein [Butyrivibrio sp. ob235]
MFTYLRMRQDFLNDLNRMREEIISLEGDNIPEIINGMRNEINDQLRIRNFSVSDYRTWFPSMELFEDIMYELGDDIGISFEYMMDYRMPGQTEEGLSGYNKRIDVIVGGYDKDGQKTLVVVEMKGWGGEYDNQNQNHHLTYINDVGISYWGRGDEDNPSKEVKEYCDQLRLDNQAIVSGDIRIIPVVWMYNFDYQNQIIDQNVEIDVIRYEIEQRYNTNGEMKFFYKNQRSEVLEFFIDIYKRQNDIFSEFRKGFEIPPLHEKIGEILSGGYNIKLRCDQKACLDDIKRRISENETGVLHIEGRAGSGKSVVAIEVLKYCRENDFSVEYLISEGAPVNAYNDTCPGVCTLANQYTETDNPARVIIFDEGHNIFPSTQRIFERIQDRSLIIYFYDPYQKTGNSIFDRGQIRVDYRLTSQFRCNMDDGYLSFIDGILDNVDDVFHTATYLDFDVKLVRNQNSLLNLVNDNNNVILTGPEYAARDRVIRLSEIDEEQIIQQWPVRYDNVFLQNNVSEDGSNLYSGVNSIRGLETDHTIVYIADDDLPFDAQNNHLGGDECVKNAYRVMLTRAMKSCYIYCENNALRNYLHDIKKIQYLRTI